MNSKVMRWGLGINVPRSSSNKNFRLELEELETRHLLSTFQVAATVDHGDGPLTDAIVGKADRSAVADSLRRESARVPSPFFGQDPLARNDRRNLREDKPPFTVSGNVLANDIDPDDNPLFVSAVNNRTNNVGVSLNGNFGTAKINANGRFTYTLNNDSRAVQSLGGGQVVTDAFSYTASNDEGGSDTAKLIINIRGTNDRPQLSNIEASPLVYKQNATRRITSQIRVSDVDDSHMQRATVQISEGYRRNQDRLLIVGSLPKGISGSFNITTGTLLLSGSATKAAYQQTLRQVAYRNVSENPNSDSRTVKFLVNDGDHYSNAQFRRIKLLVDESPENQAPTAQNHIYDAIGNVPINVPAWGGLVSGATDPENDTITVKSIDTTGLQGSVTRLQANGAFTFTPAPGFEGETTFTYTLKDDGTPPADSNTATVTIMVNDMIWFVDRENGSDVGGDGTLKDPFASFAPLNDSRNDLDEAGDAIFFYRAGRAIYDVQSNSGFALENNQSLVGEGAKGAPGDTIGDLLGINPPTFSAPLPEINGIAPAIGNSLGDVIKLARRNLVAGATVDPNAGAGLKGSNISGGNFQDLTILTNGGTNNNDGVDLTNTSGTFTFSNVTIKSETGSKNAGTAIKVNGGDATINFDNKGEITQKGGTGFQFDNADGTYEFSGPVTLYGGDAGIDILGNSNGTFTFSGLTSITDPSGPAVSIQDLGRRGKFTYDGSISSTNSGDLIQVENTAVGSMIEFNKTGGNSLKALNGGGISIIGVNGKMNVTTPTTIDNGLSTPFLTGMTVFDGTGTVSFTDTSVLNQKSINAAVEVLGYNGTVNFNNLNITTNNTSDDLGGPVGFQVSLSNIVNVAGNSNIDSNGAAAIELTDVARIGLLFNNVSTSNTGLAAGKRNGISILNVRDGSMEITGDTKFRNIVGNGMFIDNAAGVYTFANVDMDDVGGDGFTLGVVTSNTGTFNIDAGTLNNVGGDGVRMGSTFGAGSSGGILNLFNTLFKNITGFTTNLSNSKVNGSGNTAVPFSSNDGGGNTGTIEFNGGANTAP